MIYRPPNTSLASFNTDFFQFLEQLNYYSNKNTNFLLAGDFNINILNQAENLTVKFLDNMYANNLIPTINLPTRITDHTATLIDNIYTTYRNITNSSIIYCDITDHLPIILALKINKFHVINNKSRFFRNMNANNIAELNNVLQTTDWSPVINDPSLDSA